MTPPTKTFDPSEKTVLVLQGGGALGAYQGGIHEALERSGYRPSWVAGISIGAVNGAIIAGNPPGKAGERLREFWSKVSSSAVPFPFMQSILDSAFGDAAAASTVLFGAPGFFKPRLMPPFTQTNGGSSALSYYDTDELKSTLERLVDFDRINSTAKDRIRLSVGAVDIEDGNFVYFDSEKRDHPDRFPIRPEHIMASGALPPGLPPIEIGGRFYWDGGLVSNTPLQYVIDEDGRDNILAFQVDLFSQKGPMPKNLLEAAEREKDIRYSSRTRLNTDVLRRRREIMAAAERLLQKMPAGLRNDPDLKLITDHDNPSAMTLVHFIYRSKHRSTYSKDYEFSRSTIEQHWAAGRADVERTLANPSWTQRGQPQPGSVTVIDATRLDQPQP